MDLIYRTIDIIVNHAEYDLKNQPEYIVVGLCGRGQHPMEMLDWCKDLDFPNTLYTILSPSGHAWYPQPHSADDQDLALMGLNPSRKEIMRYIRMLEVGYQVPRQNIILVGYSAGGVMAIYTATHQSNNKPFGGVISLCGAILEPDNLPQCKFDETKYIVVHSIDDPIFEWEERYIPMREAMKLRSYNLNTIENKKGLHGVSLHDIVKSSLIMGKHIIDASWEPPILSQYKKK